MPIYEYRCRDCSAVSSVFFRSIGAAGANVTCERCASSRTERLISRTFVVKGAERFDAYDADRRIGEVGDIPDAGTFARWARKMGRELGETAGGEKFRELAERAEAGDDPIERVDPGHTLRYELSQRREQALDAGAGGADEPAQDAP